MKKKQDIIIDTEEVKKRRIYYVHMYSNIHENLDQVIIFQENMSNQKMTENKIINQKQKKF